MVRPQSRFTIPAKRVEDGKVWEPGPLQPLDRTVPCQPEPNEDETRCRNCGLPGSRAPFSNVWVHDDINLFGNKPLDGL